MRRTFDFMRHSRGQRGFTLVEMIVAITITAILSGIVALFIRVPLDSYFDVSRRAELTDAADLALRRIVREVQGALPNSVRVSGPGGAACTGANACYLEFLAVRSGGRYRSDPDNLGGGDILDFTSAADGSFDVLGPGAEVAAGDQIVVYNLGVSGADAYAGANRRAYSGAAGTVGNISFTATASPFPFESPSKRFHVVSGPVTYACDPTAGNQVLRRHGGYGIAAAQATPPGGSSALLASGVTGCNIAYVAGAGARNGVVSIDITLTRADPAGNAENVRLFSQAHVVNSP
jgi:MSHA biogenesis protein MshO